MAAAADLPPVEDLTGTCWRDDLWLQSYGLLTHLTALDYFALSPFYDAASNNEVARQRGLRLEQLPQGAPGIEFVLQDAQPPHLFIVRKQLRSLAGALSTLAFYYILDGTIYQAPSLHAALAGRIDRCLYSLRSAFTLLRNDLDSLGERGEEALAAELAAEVRRQEAVGAAARPVAGGAEQARRAERAVLAALLDHPLPVPAAALAAGTKPEAPEAPAAAPAAAAGTGEGPAPSGGAISRPGM